MGLLRSQFSAVAFPENRVQHGRFSCTRQVNLAENCMEISWPLLFIRGKNWHGKVLLVLGADFFPSILILDGTPQQGMLRLTTGKDLCQRPSGSRLCPSTSSKEKDAYTAYSAYTVPKEKIVSLSSSLGQEPGARSSTHPPWSLDLS